MADLPHGWPFTTNGKLAMNPYKQEQADKKRDDALRQMRELLKQGKRVAAVKAYRSATGCTLKQAMHEIERASL